MVVPHRRRESETGGVHAIRGVGRPRRSEGKSSRGLVRSTVGELATCPLCRSVWLSTTFTSIHLL
ncbi:DUF1360 domain-containing protein [Streptomyces cyaneofuscatus]